MRIALTHPYSWPQVRRGAERIVVETARALAGRGHEVTVFTAGRPAGTRRAGGVATVRFRRLFDRAALHELWFGLRVAPRLAVGRFDVVHSIMPWDALAAIGTERMGGHRTVYEEMGIPGLYWDRRRDGWARWRVVEGADVYGCMSQYALQALARDCGRQDGVRIPGGVRLDEFTPAAEREPTPTLLFSGAFTQPFKGVATLLEALPLVAEREPDVRLWLSGPGDPERLLAEAPSGAADRVDVLPLGAPGDQAHRYARAWATVLPSVRESFGMVMLESLACGTPIVTSDVGAPQEMVTASTGAVGRAEDAASLADALCRAIDLARDPATAGRCRGSVAEYDWDQGIALLLESLYAPASRDARQA